MVKPPFGTFAIVGACVTRLLPLTERMRDTPGNLVPRVYSLLLEKVNIESGQRRVAMAEIV